MGQTSIRAGGNDLLAPGLRHDCIGVPIVKLIEFAVEPMIKSECVA